MNCHKLFHRTLIAVAIIVNFNIISSLSAAVPMLDSLDRAIVDSALRLLKLNPAELGFDKMWVDDDTFRLDVVEKYMLQPLAFADYVDTTTGVVDSFAGDWRRLLEFIDQQLKVTLQTNRKEIKLPKVPNLSYEADEPFGVWIASIQAAEPLLRRFSAELDSLDRHDLLMAAPALWSEGPDSVNQALKGAWQRAAGLPVDTSRKVDSDRLLDIIKKLDMRALLEAAKIVAPAAQIVAKGVLDAPLQGEPIGKVNGVQGDVLYFQSTEFGDFVVGGKGNNKYTGNFAGIIDLGGDDIYRGRFGGALGGGLGKPYSLVIDLSGNDYYDAQGLAVAHGAGFMGVGILIDHTGDDVYRSGAYAQGAGLFGVGIHIDNAGDDDRRGDFFLQGAGHCGVGILFDEGDGDDRYLSTTWAQGFAGTFGYGLLSDGGGDDNYRCGGKFLHEPLLPKDNRSFSGGFGMGWRPRAGGGIGILYDRGEGNDFYDAEVMSFGSSYWYAIGILVDNGGNDRYSLAHYGLGVGIHLSLGAFYDRAGDDQYRSRMGVVGGTPHDLSVGIFVDGSGNDSYADCDGWGGSLTNSFGLFIDRLGDDTYAPRSGGTSLGRHNWARGFGGVAIFIDEEGKDMYPREEPAKDSSIWIQSGWGVGIDMARDVVTEKEAPIPEPALTAEDSAKSIEELFNEASQWEVGSARESVKRARKALLTKGPEAARWIIENKINTQNSLEMRPMEDVIRAYPDSAGPLLVTKLTPKSDRWTLGNTAALLAALKWKPAVDGMVELLKDKSVEKSHRALLGALGQIGDKRATPIIEQFTKSEKERNRLAALGAARALKDTLSIPVLIKCLDDPLFTVRSSAVETMPVFNLNAVQPIKDYVSSVEAEYPELGIRILGRIAHNLRDSADVVSKQTCYDIKRFIEMEISSKDRNIRAEAVDALYRISGAQMRQWLDARMEGEFDLVVKAAYERVKKEMVR